LLLHVILDNISGYDRLIEVASPCTFAHLFIAMDKRSKRSKKIKKNKNYWISLLFSRTLLSFLLINSFFVFVIPISVSLDFFLFEFWILYILVPALIIYNFCIFMVMCIGLFIYTVSILLFISFTTFYILFMMRIMVFATWFINLVFVILFPLWYIFFLFFLILYRIIHIQFWF